MKSLPDYFELPQHPKPPLQTLFRGAGEEALDLLSKMLTWDPLKRISAREVKKILLLGTMSSLLYGGSAADTP